MKHCARVPGDVLSQLIYGETTPIRFDVDAYHVAGWPSAVLPSEVLLLQQQRSKCSSTIPVGEDARFFKWNTKKKEEERKNEKKKKEEGEKVREREREWEKEEEKWYTQ